jgi:guanylate kinase
MSDFVFHVPCPGDLFVISAPSGAGKTSLVRQLLAEEVSAAVSVSHTTRPPRPGEINGQHYHFVDRATFQALALSGAFLESAEVFGNYYGTSFSAVERLLWAGRRVILEIDWQGAQQVAKRFQEVCRIFIVPPSLAVLEERLQGRGQDSAEVIQARMAKACAEISHYQEFDYIVVNDDFSSAVQDLKAIFRAEGLRRHRQEQRQAALFASLRCW